LKIKKKSFSDLTAAGRGTLPICTQHSCNPRLYLINSHSGDESFQAITFTDTANSEQTGENTRKTQENTQNTKNPKLNVWT